jgi:hypothetical protein
MKIKNKYFSRASVGRLVILQRKLQVIDSGVRAVCGDGMVRGGTHAMVRGGTVLRWNRRAMGIGLGLRGWWGLIKRAFG